MGQKQANGYVPPPPTAPPPSWWRPAVVLPQAPPRHLPEQDHDAIDEAERAASRFTTILGGICAAVIAILMAVLCGELLGTV